MARISDIERERKMNRARQLYVNGTFSIAFIADTVDVQPDTLKDWIKKENWNDLKTSTIISPKQIQQMILKSAEDIQMGKKPKHSPDELAKLVSAYDKITEMADNVAYLYDAYTHLFNFILEEASEEKSIQKREDILAFGRRVSTYVDRIIDKALSK